MMKKIRCFPIIFLSVTLLACQGGVSQTTKKLETYTPSVHILETIKPSTPTKAWPTKSATASVLITKELSDLKTPIPKAIAPEIVNEDINFLHELSGILYIGSRDTGVYVKVDFDNDRISRLKLPNDCLLLSNGFKAVCEEKDFSVIKEIFVWDVPARQRVFTDKRDIGSWELSSSERLLAYTPIEPDETIQTMEAYDLNTSTAFSIGRIDQRGDTLYIPWLSNSGQTLIGMNFKDLYNESDDTWYMMDTTDMKAEPILSPYNIAATDSVEWSPDDSLVALVGFYRDDEISSVGTLQCKKTVLFYDPKAKAVRFSVKVPEGRCFSPIALYQDSLWSSDNSRLALVLDQKDICIVDVAKQKPSCDSITNYGQSEDEIRSLAWSPDSNYLAFKQSNGKIQVFSFRDNAAYLIAKVDDVNYLPIGNNLVWGQ
jgi:hypothetical protein